MIKLHFGVESTSTRLFENFLHMSRIFTKFETKLYMLKIFSFLLFGHYKVTKNQRYVQLFFCYFFVLFLLVKFRINSANGLYLSYIYSML